MESLSPLEGEHLVPQTQDRLLPIYNPDDDGWEHMIYLYFRTVVRDTLLGNDPGGARALFERLVQDEHRQPQGINYFELLAFFLGVIAEKMEELEGQSAALAQLYCMLQHQGIERGGEDSIERFWGMELYDMARGPLTPYLLVPPGYYKYDNLRVPMPDPNFYPPASSAELAHFGRRYFQYTRIWCFAGHVEAGGGYKTTYYNYPGWLAAMKWDVERLDEALDDPLYYYDLDLVVSAVAPVALLLRDEEEIGKSEWGREEEFRGLQSIRAMKMKLRELVLVETLPLLTRARLAVLVEDLDPAQETKPKIIYEALPSWRQWLLQRLPDALSSKELYSAFIADQTSLIEEAYPPLHAVHEAALEILNTVFECSECDYHIKTLAHFYTLIVEGAQNQAMMTDFEQHLYKQGVQTRLSEHLVPPGYCMIESQVVPDPSCTQTLDLPTLAAYGRAHASWLRVWALLGHVDARANSVLPHNMFPGHFILTHWTPDRIRRAGRLPGHHAELDMLAAALYPLRRVLADNAEFNSSACQKDELLAAVNETLVCEDVLELTRAKLAIIVEDIVSGIKED